MFILKRQDVEISTISHPQKAQQIPILHYQGQTFRLLSVFTGAQKDEALAFWRDLTENRGKACVLLEEPERYSVWGKVRLDELQSKAGGQGVLAVKEAKANPLWVQTCLLLLQGVYLEVEDFLGGRQARLFQHDLNEVFDQWNFPQTDTPERIEQLLSMDPLATLQLPPWDEQLLNVLIAELHRLGHTYFGNSSFAVRVLEALDAIPSSERSQALAWLRSTPKGKLWQ
ncbi:Npun_F0813 family protein [Leptolyngbya sp. FACHB-261]|uniref:Npun_F0813 family protein n=1 Tax=Leptolyngbya sp. FACHB-261 TaxID=2692806 RepID=UPI001682D3F9|nr:Npun_F0813 family protein [Leptolyngbya sp. FACHB-261]MBD2099813.1 hypothetical protein [Leptolyngbya sp. FACHB-261]